MRTYWFIPERCTWVREGRSKQTGLVLVKTQRLEDLRKTQILSSMIGQFKLEIKKKSLLEIIPRTLTRENCD